MDGKSLLLCFILILSGSATMSGSYKPSKLPSKLPSESEGGFAVSRKGENIYRRKDGRWEGRCVQGRNADGSYKYRYVYARSYQEARQKLNIEKSKSVRPINPLMDIGNREGRIKRADENPFALLAEGWLAAKKGRVKESTYIKYRNLVSSYILPELGGMAWNSINRETIEFFCQKMLSSGGKKGEGLSSKTVADILSVISSIFRYASYHGIR